MPRFTKAEKAKLIAMLQDEEVMAEVIDLFPSGVMSDLEIVQAVEKGQIFIDPFDPSLVQTSSVDVRLGEWFWVMKDTPENQILSPYDQDSINEYFDGPYRATTHRRACEKAGLALFPGIPEDEMVIIIRPDENLLCMTLERIGARYRATTMIHAKSTFGRWNIGFADDAGWGDIGYTNWWTLEARNRNNHRSFPLVVGQPYAQVIFFHAGRSSRSYEDGGHYQRSNLSAMEWARTHMVPRHLELKARKAAQGL